MQELKLDLEAKGQRIDIYVASKLDISRTQVKRLLEEGAMLLDGKSVSASVKLRGTELLQWQIPKAKPSQLEPQNIALDVLYADEDIIVLNKPAGLVVHPGAGNWNGTLVHALLYHFPDMHIGDTERPGIVHRLDKDTSGVMVCARHDKAHQAMTRAFKSRDVKKIYRAFCVGTFREQVLDIVTGHARHPTDRKRFTTRIIPSEQARLAHSQVKILHMANGVSEVSVLLLTGRTHQIRAHFADMHKPLLQDKLYGGDKAVARLPMSPLKSVAMKLNRQALHAESLSFLHPITQQPMHFTAPLPEDLAQIHEALLF